MKIRVKISDVLDLLRVIILGGYLMQDKLEDRRESPRRIFMNLFGSVRVSGPRPPEHCESMPSDSRRVSRGPFRHQRTWLDLFTLILVMSIVILPRGAVAESIDAAQAAYVKGQFVEAAQLAKAIGTSDGYALAAKSLTIFGRHIAADQEKKRLFEQAMALSNKAIQANPENPNAYLELARAMGRHSDHISRVEATKGKYAKKIREAIDNAIRLNPEFASAHISLGRWHAGIIAKAGAFVARVTFGAQKKLAIESFERAIELDPEDKADYFSMAVGFEALDEKKYKEEVHDLLKRAIGLPAKDVYDRIFHDKAVELLKSRTASDG